MKNNPKSKWTQTAAFINRQKETEYLQGWIAEQPGNILFLYGPKSSGKTTLLNKFIAENESIRKTDIKHFNLRELLIVNYQDFIQAFFEIDYSKCKGDIKERREYDLKVFKLTTEILKGLDQKALDPFAVMKKELQTSAAKGKQPVIIIDELQALEGIYFNGQRELLKEMFNFFVAITKESHLCHVIIASSDGYFIERIYNDSKLKKTSKFLEVDYLSKEDTLFWLDNLQKHSNITRFTLTQSQKESIWHNFGGSCWEISAFLGDILLEARNGQVADDIFNTILEKKLIAARSIFVEYIKLSQAKQAMFRLIHTLRSQGKHLFEEADMGDLLTSGMYSEQEVTDELTELVRQNILAYNPVTALFSLQGRSLEIGLDMYIERLNRKIRHKSDKNHENITHP